MYNLYIIILTIIFINNLCLIDYCVYYGILLMNNEIVVVNNIILTKHCTQLRAMSYLLLVR